MSAIGVVSLAERGLCMSGDGEPGDVGDVGSLSRKLPLTLSILVLVK